MLAADWLRLSCRVDGVGQGGGGDGGDRHASLTSLSLSPILPDGDGRGGGRRVGEGTGTHISLSPILSHDILDSIKPALKFEGALL